MIIAMKEISAVPANSGTAPKEPDEPTWSARIAVCGLQEVPNRNSIGETIEKKRNASKATEATIPMVVKTAIVEQPISSHSMTRSTRLRARSSGVMRERTAITAPMAITMTSTVRAMRLMPRRCRYSAEAARTASLTVDAGTLPATRLRTSFMTSDRSFAERSRTPAGQVIDDQPQDDGVLECQPQSDDRERGQARTTSRSSFRNDWGANAAAARHDCRRPARAIATCRSRRRPPTSVRAQ